MSSFGWKDHKPLKAFQSLVESSGSIMDFVTSATMTIEFDLEQTSSYPHDNKFTENPFYCEIKIIDEK